MPTSRAPPSLPHLASEPYADPYESPHSRHAKELQAYRTFEREKVLEERKKGSPRVHHAASLHTLPDVSEAELALEEVRPRQHFPAVSITRCRIEQI